MCFQKYHVRFCTYCSTEWGGAQAGELVRCSNYHAGYSCRTMQDAVRQPSMCQRCREHQRSVEALSRAVEGGRDRDEIVVSRMSARQLDDRRRQAEANYRRGGQLASTRYRALSPRRPLSPRRREPPPRRTRGYASRAQEDQEAAAEEEEQYRQNRRREEMRRAEEQSRREEYRRGYPTSYERSRRGYY